MLSNAYFLEKFRFDTAENEPAKILLIFPILLTLNPNPAAENQLVELCTIQPDAERTPSGS